MALRPTRKEEQSHGEQAIEPGRAIVDRARSGTDEREPERVPEQQRDLEGLSGMVPGTRRSDNRDDQPDAYLEFNQMRPSGDERLRGAREEAELDRVDQGEPTEDKA